MLAYNVKNLINRVVLQIMDETEQILLQDNAEGVYENDYESTWYFANSQAGWKRMLRSIFAKCVEQGRIAITNVSLKVQVITINVE